MLHRDATVTQIRLSTLLGDDKAALYNEPASRKLLASAGTVCIVPCRGRFS